MNLRIYIAGPISNGHAANARDIYKNVREAEKYYEALIQNGWTPICPHLSYHAWLGFANDVHWDRWIELDLDLIDSCAAVLRIPGESKGAEVEVVYAKEHDIPIIKVLGPLTAFHHLEKQFGKPEKRKDLQKYLDMIRSNK